MTDKDLFGQPAPPMPVQPKRKSNYQAINAHKKLIQIHGEVEGEKCKNCIFMVCKSFAKKYHKCEKLGTTSNPATDWRVNWTACGLFKKEEE